MPVDMKNLIAESFKKLVQQGDADKITVKSLIEECHISRQTFYYHFQDILDVIEWSMRRETQRLVEQSMKTQDMRAALQIFISFTAHQFPLLEKLMNSQRRPQLEALMVDSMEAYLGQMARYQAKDTEVPLSDMDRKVLLRYNACGLVGVLLVWGKENHSDEKRLAAQLERILSGQITGWSHGQS